MKIDPRRGRILVLTEPIGIVRMLGSLLLICSGVSLAHGLLMIRDHDHGVGISSPPFWLFMALFTCVLGLALSSPPRWRWIFDIDLNLVRSVILRFNIPTGAGQSFPISGLVKAEVVKSPEGSYCVDLIDSRETRIRIDGIRSRLSGMPKRAAFRLNQILAEYIEQNRLSADLNDPGVTLREVGIIAPVDPLLAGPALEELLQALSPDLQQLTTDRDSAYDVAGSIAHAFFNEHATLFPHPEIRSLTPLQMVLFFDLCIPALKTMHHSQYLALASLIDRGDERRVREAVYSYALATRFNRYVAGGFRNNSVAPPTAVDLQGVLPECRLVIATISALAHTTERPLNPPRSYDGREVVFADAAAQEKPSLLTLKSFKAGIEELSSGMNADWTRPAVSTNDLQNALTRIERVAPIPMRGVLVRACARAAVEDEILEPHVWLLLRSIADALSVNVPSFVPEPVSAARLEPAL